MRIEDLFDRLKREFIKIKILQGFLDAIIAVLAVNLILFSLGLSQNLVFLASTGLFCFVISYYYRVQDYSVEIYEDKNSELNEILRTARDNLDQRDEVTHSLFNDVADRTRSITSESILPSENIMKKLSLIGGLAILTTLSGLMGASADLNFDDHYSSLSDLTDWSEDSDDFMRNSSEVMGDPSEMDRSGSDIDIDVEGSGESFEESVRRSMESESDLLFEDSDDQIDEDLELAKRYNLKLREENLN